MAGTSNDVQQGRDTPHADDALNTYETISDSWITRSEQIDIEGLYQPVRDLLPPPPASVLDIGAGTGRDAAWFAAKGHPVTAAEPAARLRSAGEALHAGKAIEWSDAQLPDLGALDAGNRFDCQVMIGVWQHLPAPQRPPAMKRLYELASEKGRVVMSLRHGPGAPGRPVFPIDASATAELAKANGFSVLRSVLMPSMQEWNRKEGVEWTWLVLEALPR